MYAAAVGCRGGLPQYAAAVAVLFYKLLLVKHPICRNCGLRNLLKPLLYTLKILSL
jgi:hypothetical protein